MLVTVMIPTYNQKEYVGCAIESALGQTYAHIEVVVADDASPDPGVAAVLDGYRDHPRVRIFRNEKNLGRVANYRKTLYDRAQGEWVVNLDGDDYFLDPHFIEAAVGIINDHGEVKAVVGGCSVLKQSGDLKALPPNMTMPRIVDTASVFESLLRGSLFPFHNTTLYSRKYAMEVGFYEHDIVSSDLESFLRLFARGPVGVLPRQVAVWREHGGNTSGAMAFDDYIGNIEVFASVKRTAKVAGLALPGSFLEGWAARYAYKKGKDYAYRLLKESRDPSLCLAYIRALSAVSRIAALRVLFQPKIVFNILFGFFR